MELVERVFGPRAAGVLCELQVAAEKEFQAARNEMSRCSRVNLEMRNNQVCSTYIVEKTARYRRIMEGGVVERGICDHLLPCYLCP